MSAARAAVLALALACWAPSALAQRGSARPRATTTAEVQAVLAPLVEAYGPSGREDAVREVVRGLLPAWADPVVDTAGNLRVHLGPPGPPAEVYVAHVDEIGFAVTAVREDGQLTLRSLGGFMPSLFEAEPALVHTRHGTVPAVFTLRDSVGAAPRRTPMVTVDGRPALAFRVDLGTRSAAETESLGVTVGDVVTMPRRYVRLAGTRATARSFDDRVGCAAAILALRRLDPARVTRRTLFVFSTREEVGLQGARAVAAELAATPPYRVYALDTFVSADGPLEVPTFADAPIGAGAVVRAVDNSSVTPPLHVDSVVALARQRGIPLLAGTTNGGNDGSVFTRYGAVNVPIGWPLRYSHSPAEVIDLRDVAAMADLVTALVERR
jgi:putative aminopeptidase FrvX